MLIDREEIRRRVLAKESDNSISKNLGCSQVTVNHIRRFELMLPRNFVPWHELPPSKPSPNNDPTYFRFRLRRGRCGNAHTSSNIVKPLSDFLRQEFIGRTFYFDRKDPTSIMQFLFSIFRSDLHVDSNLARRITHFLRQQKFSRAKIHALLLHLGYHYSPNPSSLALRHMAVNGYWDRPPKEPVLSPEFLKLGITVI